ncbi:hypothetical protein [Caulobacter segnis]|uniref:Uncharacterized protein n=1 Tax=Caulobacter segnis TaxID=88688 RepID=A0A2W5WND9_9CAUL|nr:hypothetical protein [Caulobacter segnis]PZR35518.1 MAG: hypothetical protein DI526_07095 [Caulobacter segnis]
MFSRLITFFRRLDPAWEYSLRFAPAVDDFSWAQILDERMQGPQNGSYLVTACGGLVVLAEYGRKTLAREHLIRAVVQSRTVRRFFTYNGWRLRLWCEARLRRLSSR